MNEQGTDSEAPRGQRRRWAMAIGATALALSAVMATGGTASATPAPPVQETPAPGWPGAPVEERCVVTEPGDGPVIFAGDEVVRDDGVEEHRQVDILVPAPDGTEPDLGAPGRDHLRRAPAPGCEEAPVSGPHCAPEPFWREK